MTPPYYRVVVASLTRGWSYTVTDGDVPDPNQPVHLADGLTFDWSFVADQVPGQLDTGVLKFNLYARDVDDLPLIDRGDLVTLDVRIGAAGSRIAAPPPFTVTEVEVEVDPELVNDPNVYAATASVTAVDVLAYLRTVEPLSGSTPAGAAGFPSTLELWRPQMAQIARQIGRAVGCPTWWADNEAPLYPTRADAGHWQNVTGTYPWFAFEGSGFDMLTKSLNSHQPGGYTHTIVPGYQAVPSAFPAGYRRVGPTTRWGDNDNDFPGWALVEPETALRYYLQPASRKTDTAELPLRFVMSGATLTVEPNPVAGGGHSRGAIDAGWCDLPVTLRRSREHRVNDVRILGREAAYAPGGTSPAPASPGVREYTDAADIAARGITTAREVPTQLYFGEVPYGTTPTVDVKSREDPIIAANFLADPSQDQSWVYDDFTMWSSRIPDGYATAVLTKLTPRSAGETDGDGQVLRHLTVYRSSPRVLPVDALAPISGFVVRGRMRVVEGDIQWTIGLTPGLPVRTAATPTPVTVGEVQAAAYGNTTNPNVDDLVRVADLDYIDA